MNRGPQAAGVDSRLARLYARTRAGIRPGLESIRRVLAAMGNPEKSFLVVHVAGTNGKGSTCAMIESILRAHGLRTGLYTSPHLVHFHERIQVAGKPVTDAELERLLSLADAADVRGAKESGDRECTFFELATAMAFQHFADAGVQVAVVEVGMGGRWDATNTVQPVVTVITPVALDHMEDLGTDFASIVGEKAGILKSGARAVCSAQDPEARVIIEEQARRLAENVRWADAHVRRVRAQRDARRADLRDGDRHGAIRPGDPPLSGPHQVGNAAGGAGGRGPFSRRWAAKPIPTS
ncbi:MAG: Mur ligase family protein [Kiritimatiellia bacterium]